MRPTVLWLTVAAAIAVAFALAANSPLLAWRDPVYIIAGFAGVAALGLLLVQPALIISGPSSRTRRFHRWAGTMLIAMILLHVVGLWITSPPDVIDALTFTSPTPFSAWGVIAMWAAFIAAALGAYKRRLRPRLWRHSHKTTVVIVAICTVIHAILIEGTMEPISKAILSTAIALTTLTAVIGWTLRKRRQTEQSQM